MTFAKLTEGLNIIEAGMTVLENKDSDEQNVATARKSLENSFCCYKELLTRERSQVQVVDLDESGIKRKVSSCTVVEKTK